MKIALFCAYDSEVTVVHAQTIHRLILASGHQVWLDLRMQKHMGQTTAQYFDSSRPIDQAFDLLFSVGGDGTLLRSIPFVHDSGVPILGINTGRLGFLTSLQKESLEKGLQQVFDGQYELVTRSLMALSTEIAVDAIQDFGYALNEVSIMRKNTTSMLSVETRINDAELTTYWADGLIAATPTGSTGYSLSNGGPVLTPDSPCFVLNPIAPHNINLRPLIVPDTACIDIRVNGRGTHHLVSMDARILSVPMNTSIRLQKAPFSIQTLQIHGNDFFQTLRNKLFWGYDTRNRQ